MYIYYYLLIEESSTAVILPVVIAVVSLLAAVSAAFIAWKYKDKLCAKRKVKPRAVQKKMNTIHVCNECVGMNLMPDRLKSLLPSLAQCSPHCNAKGARG